MLSLIDNVQLFYGVELGWNWFLRSNNATLELLGEKFGETIISRNGSLSWSRISCDLMPFV